jgi:hypothetical protein
MRALFPGAGARGVLAPASRERLPRKAAGMPASKRRNKRGKAGSAPRRQPARPSRAAAAGEVRDQLLGDAFAQALFEGAFGFCAQHPRCVVSLPWQGGRVTVVYRPTPGALRLLAGLSGATIADRGVWPTMARLLAETVREWGLTERDEPLPITEAAIMGLTAGVPLAITRAMSRDIDRRFQEYARERGIPLGAEVGDRAGGLDP